MIKHNIFPSKLPRSISDEGSSSFAYFKAGKAFYEEMTRHLYDTFDPAEQAAVVTRWLSYDHDRFAFLQKELCNRLIAGGEVAEEANKRAASEAWLILEANYLLEIYVQAARTIRESGVNSIEFGNLRERHVADPAATRSLKMGIADSKRDKGESPSR